MTIKDFEIERLERIIRVLTKYIEKGEFKYKGKRRKFIFKYSLSDRMQTKSQIALVQEKLKKLQPQKDEILQPQI